MIIRKMKEFQINGMVTKTRKKIQVEALPRPDYYVYIFTSRAASSAAFGFSISKPAEICTHLANSGRWARSRLFRSRPFM